MHDNLNNKKDQIPHEIWVGLLVSNPTSPSTCITLESNQDYQQAQRYTCCSTLLNRGLRNQPQEMAWHIGNDEGFPPPWGRERGEDENELKRKAFYWPEMYVFPLDVSYLNNQKTNLKQ